MVDTTNLISYYKLDETTGTVADDAHGSNDGTNYGATINQTGIIGKAYSFDGTDRVSITGLTSTSGTYTFSFWAYQTSASNDLGSYFDTSNTGAGDRLFFGPYYTTGTTEFYINDGGTYRYFGVAPTVDTTLRHYVYVFNAVTGKADLYINGTHAGNQLAYTSRNIDGATAFGANRDGNFGIIGKIDEFGIWSRALTSTEVSDLYNNGSGLAYPFITDVTISPSALTLSTTDEEPSYFIDITSGALNMNMSILSPSRILPIFPNKGKIGTREISKSYPSVSGIEEGQKHDGRIINLVASTSHVRSKDYTGLY